MYSTFLQGMYHIKKSNQGQSCIQFQVKITGSQPYLRGLPINTKLSRSPAVIDKVTNLYYLEYQ